MNKKYNNILEAINKGIQIALDDYKDVEQNNSSFDYNDIINSDENIYILLKYKKLLSKFNCFITQNVHDIFLPMFITESEFNEFTNISLKHNIKYKFFDKTSLSKAIYNISYKFPKANLNFFDISNIDDLSWLFHNKKFNGNISEWDVSHVTRMDRMFCQSSFNSDISKWNVSNVRNMYGMFEEATEFNQDISKWNMSEVKDISHMFNGATNFNQDISQWDLSNIFSDVYVSQTFNNCPIKQEYKPKFKCKWKSKYQTVK